MTAVGSRARAHVTLALLTAIYALNFVDRQLLSIVLEPVQRELDASDTQMGLLTGTAFALFYTLAGIPLARLADRGSRRVILALGLGVWSALTAASGLAQSYAQLALARVGVGVGEAACTPPAHSLLAQLYAPAKRATAIAIYSSGIYLGTFVAYGVGGWLYEQRGWREMFLIFGALGVALALLAPFVVCEPPREHVERGATTIAALREVWASSAFRHLAFGAGIKSIAGYGLLMWVPTFIGRVHGLTPGEAGRWLGPILGVGGALGTLAGGALADRLGRRDPRLRLRSAAWATLAALPFVYAFLFAGDVRVAFAAYVPATVLGAMYLGPVFAEAQSLAAPDRRATAAAVLLFLINLIGLGLGPWLVGQCSDALAVSCGADSLRYALAAVALSYAWGAWHLLRAARFAR